MTNDGGEKRESVVAVVHGCDVLVVGGPTGLRLPQVAESFPSSAQVFAAVGFPPGEAVVAAPSRLVECTPARVVHLLATDSRPNGTEWVAVNELDEPAGVLDAIRLGSDEWSGRRDRPANRPAWFAPTWLPDVDDWIGNQLHTLARRRAGRSEPVEIWSLSAVLRIPTTTLDGAAAAPVFFKATCDWFRAEPAITQAIAAISPANLPRVLAADHRRAWMLMDPFPGDGVEPPAAKAVPAAVAMARLQMTLADHLPVLRAAGLPDRTLQPTRTGLIAVVEDSVELPQLTADERADATAMLPWLLERLDAFADIGLPYSVTHGDLHVGNLAVDGDEMTIFDWTDAAIGFPFLDAAHLAVNAREPMTDRVLAAYADAWSEGYERKAVERALAQAALVDRIYQTVSYEGIYRSCEPDSLWEMRGVVAFTLRQLIERWHAATGQLAV